MEQFTVNEDGKIFLTYPSEDHDGILVVEFANPAWNVGDIIQVTPQDKEDILQQLFDYGALGLRPEVATSKQR